MLGAMEMLWTSALDSPPPHLALGALSTWDLLGLPWKSRNPQKSSSGALGPLGCTVLTGSPKRAPWDEELSRGPMLFYSISHKPHSCSQPDPNRFDRDRLFSVVARGVPEDLTGLLEYLRRTSKYLTDSCYTGRTALQARATKSCQLC